MSDPGKPSAGPDVPQCAVIGMKSLSCPDHSAFLRTLSCLTAEMEEVVTADKWEILRVPFLPLAGLSQTALNHNTMFIKPWYGKASSLLLITSGQTAWPCPAPAPLQVAGDALLIYTTGGEIWAPTTLIPSAFTAK